MNKIYNKILTVVMAGLMLSCSEDFLELSPQQSVAVENALTNLDDYKSSITGIYNEMSVADYYGRYFILIPDVMSDDVKQNSQANRVKNYAQYVASVTDSDARDIWTNMYQAINAANTIINATVEVPPTVKAEQDHMIGEAYALRGLIYFDLVRLYAHHYTFSAGGSHPGVPITLVFDPEALPSRNTVKEVYDQAIADMTMAITLMGDSRSGNSNTLSLTAVKALLARVYLYKEDWPNAELMATQVIADGTYALESNANYTDLWTSDNSPESIFEVSMTEADNRGSDALGRMYVKEGYGDYLPSDDVVSLYDPADVRLGVFKPDAGLSGDYAPFRMDKYPDPLSWDNTKVIRLAEVYLIRAEARAEQGGAKEAGARTDLDMVHQRGLATAPNNGDSGQALKDAIFNERRLELCFEGQRLWDLRRKKKDIVRTQCTTTNGVCTIPYAGSNLSDRVMLPIPQVEMDVNPNIAGNPGYGN